MYRIVETTEFTIWINSISYIARQSVFARLTRIKLEGHFGDVKRIDKSLAELRWKNGTRVYFAYYVDEIGRTIVVILGGSKKTQKRDILKAKRILKNLSEV